MTRQLAKIKQQIAALEKKAQELVREQNGKVIARIKALIAKHGITPADLGFADSLRPDSSPKSLSPAKSRPKRRPAGAGVPMYRDPISGKTWTGRGKPPAWIAGVSDRAAFLIGDSSNGLDGVPADQPSRGKEVSRAKRKPKTAAALETSQLKPKRARVAARRAKPAVSAHAKGAAATLKSSRRPKSTTTAATPRKSSRKARKASVLAKVPAEGDSNAGG